VSNERIRHPEVRVIGEDGSQLGIMQTRQALWTARDQGMDLIEITADAKPPVVRIVDLNKWIYNLRRAKKEQDRKARENATIIKEIQLRPVTDKHDIEVKQEHAKEFLADSAKVKVVIKFRGRELAFAQKGFEIMETFISGIGPCKIEKAPEMNGRMLMAILAPQSKKA
jgi:translation initiation factor IF-3